MNQQALASFDLQFLDAKATLTATNRQRIGLKLGHNSWASGNIYYFNAPNFQKSSRFVQIGEASGPWGKPSDLIKEGYGTFRPID